MIISWSCETTATSTETCTVISTSTPDIMYGDWLYALSIILFIISFIAWSYIWSPIDKIK